MATGYPEGSKEFTRFLGPGVGYGMSCSASKRADHEGVVVGIGALFAIVMSSSGLACLQLTTSRAHEAAIALHQARSKVCARVHHCFAKRQAWSDLLRA